MPGSGDPIAPGIVDPRSGANGGDAAWALDGLSPVYEGVEVGGRRLTRLKVAAPAAGAAAVCAAAGIDDPWCNRVA